MTSKLLPNALTLKQFVLRQSVLKLYHDIFRTIREVPDENTRKSLKEWARSDFRKNKDVVDDYVIKSLLKHGEKSLKELRNSLAMSKTKDRVDSEK